MINVSNSKQAQKWDEGTGAFSCLKKKKKKICYTIYSCIFLWQHSAWDSSGTHWYKGQTFHNWYERQILYSLYCITFWCVRQVLYYLFILNNELHHQYGIAQVKFVSIFTMVDKFFFFWYDGQVFLRTFVSRRGFPAISFHSSLPTEYESKSYNFCTWDS